MPVRPVSARCRHWAQTGWPSAPGREVRAGGRGDGGQWGGREQVGLLGAGVEFEDRVGGPAGTARLRDTEMRRYAGRRGLISRHIWLRPAVGPLAGYIGILRPLVL